MSVGPVGVDVRPVDSAARSLLFVPGDRPERFDKALGSGADAVILDLEDAVAPAAKARARDAVVGWLAGSSRAVLVRINAADTAWHADDLAMLRPFAHAIPMLAKADAAGSAAAIDRLGGRPLVALLETVRAFLDLHRLAAVPGVVRIAFGSIDFGVESGITDAGDAMTAVRTAIVLASCAAGLAAPIDGVTLELTDAAVIVAQARRSREAGFGGKLCIHPRQVPAVNAAFEPTPEERERAARIVAACEAGDGGVTVVDGRMVDKPVVDWARRVLNQPPEGLRPSPLEKGGTGYGAAGKDSPVDCPVGGATPAAGPGLPGTPDPCR